MDAGGLSIVSSEKTPDEALHQAKTIIDEMLAERPDIRDTLVDQGVRVAVAADSEVLTDIPEHRDIYERSPGTDWNPRVQGGGIGGKNPVVWEGNVLCNSMDVFPYEDIAVHELAHTILNWGVERQAGGREFKERLKAAYKAAVDAGLWEYTYAGSNVEEYWAEGVQAWHGLNDPPGPIHNDINTREELEEYDPALADLLQEALGDVEVTSSCHDTYEDPPTVLQGTVVGPNGGPLKGMGVWAWGGSRENSGFAWTNELGVFVVRVPDGTFTLDIWAGEGCSLVGRYDGDGGLTTVSSEAATIVIAGADVKGIEITLPAAPEDLPRIGHCA